MVRMHMCIAELLNVLQKICIWCYWFYYGGYDDNINGDDEFDGMSKPFDWNIIHLFVSLKV